MRFIRMYSGEDGCTHFEDLDPEFTSYRDDQLHYVDVQGVLGARIQRNNPGVVGDFHTEPRRQLVIYFSGSREMISSTGESRIIGPGDILLAEDTTGEGHRTVPVSDPQEFVLLPLPPGMSVEDIFKGGTRGS